MEDDLALEDEQHDESRRQDEGADEGPREVTLDDPDGLCLPSQWRQSQNSRHFRRKQQPRQERYRPPAVPFTPQEPEPERPQRPQKRRRIKRVTVPQEQSHLERRESCLHTTQLYAQ